MLERPWNPSDAMLKAHVGLARKFSQNFNSTGYSVELEGEIIASMDQPEAVLAQIQRLFQLSEQALEEAMKRPANSPSQVRLPLEAGGGTDQRAGSSATCAPAKANGKAPPSHRDEPATARQIQYIKKLAARHGWSATELDERIAAFLGEIRTLAELAKKEAGRVIDELARTAPVSGRR